MLQEPRPPQRASLRIKGLASDGASVAEELRNGQIIIKGGVAGKGYQQSTEEEPRRKAKPTGALQNVLAKFEYTMSIKRMLVLLAES